MLKKVWLLSFLIFTALFLSSDLYAQPPIFKFFNKMHPLQIANITSCNYNGQIWLFYEKMPIFPESVNAGEQTGAPKWEGKTYYVVWDGNNWTKEEEFNNKIYNVISDGKKIIVLVDSGYKIYKDGYWSDLIGIKGLSNGFASLSPKGIYLFYNRDHDLVYRILDGDTLSEENVAQNKWEYNRGSPSFMNQNYSRAVYAYDKVWLFYANQSKEGSAIYCKTFSKNQWGEETFVTNGINYSLVVRNGQIYLFFLDWMSPKPSDMSISTAVTNMMLTSYMIFNGDRWSEINHVQTGRPMMLIDSLTMNNDLWLFVGDLASINYLELTDSTWSKIKSISIPNPETTFNFISNFIYFIFFSLIVWLFSRNIEKHAKVSLQIGQELYQCASLFRRYIAYSIDFVILYLIFMIVGIGMNSSEGNMLFDHFWVMLSVMSSFYFLGTLLYFVILEGKWGKTVGKFIMKIKVISEDSKPCGFKKALIRNVLRFVDGFLGYLVGAAIFANSKKHQRLGDRIGKTYVVLD